MRRGADEEHSEGRPAKNFLEEKFICRRIFHKITNLFCRNPEDF
jgi:hypothetical protein